MSLLRVSVCCIALFMFIGFPRALPYALSTSPKLEDIISFQKSLL